MTNDEARKKQEQIIWALSNRVAQAIDGFRLENGEKPDLVLVSYALLFLSVEYGKQILKKERDAQLAKASEGE